MPLLTEHLRQTHLCQETAVWEHQFLVGPTDEHKN